MTTPTNSHGLCAHRSAWFLATSPLPPGRRRADLRRGGHRSAGGQRAGASAPGDCPATAVGAEAPDRHVSGAVALHAGRPGTTWSARRTSLERRHDAGAPGQHADRREGKPRTGRRIEPALGPFGRLNCASFARRAAEVFGGGGGVAQARAAANGWRHRAQVRRCPGSGHQRFLPAAWKGRAQHRQGLAPTTACRAREHRGDKHGISCQCVQRCDHRRWRADHAGAPRAASARTALRRRVSKRRGSTSKGPRADADHRRRLAPTRSAIRWLACSTSCWRCGRPVARSVGRPGAPRARCGVLLDRPRSRAPKAPGRAQPCGRRSTSAAPWRSHSPAVQRLRPQATTTRAQWPRHALADRRDGRCGSSTASKSRRHRRGIGRQHDHVARCRDGQRGLHGLAEQFGHQHTQRFEAHGAALVRCQTGALGGPCRSIRGAGEGNRTLV